MRFVVLILALLTACAPLKPKVITLTKVETKTLIKWETCMDPMPAIEPWPEWSSIDRLGNVLLSGYMAKKVRDDRYVLEKYISEMYARCYYLNPSAKGVWRQR